MFKKIMLVSATAIATTSVAMATTTPYLGASVGITNNTNTVKVLGSNYTGGAYRGIPFNLYAGYGGTMGQTLYLAGELLATIATANISDDTALKSSYGIGASIIPGFMINDRTLAFGRVGVLRSRFTNNNAWQNGGQFGLGLQTSLSQCVDLRAEYDFVAYEAQNINLGVTTASVAPRADQVSVGLVYRLD